VSALGWPLAAALALLLGITVAADPACATRPAPRVPEVVMAFGDSFTAGIGTDDPATQAYPAQAGVAGYGIHGTTTTRLRSWWPSYLAELSVRPTVAVVLVGLGDVVLEGATARQTIAGLRAVKRLGRSLGVRVTFGTLPPLIEGSAWAEHDATRLAVNTWIRSRRTHVDYSAALSCGPWLCPAYVGSWNDLHPNAAGAAAMADALRGWISAGVR
jgi:lysophospholipase L1-like esterase